MATDQEAWLEEGIASGWISEPACVTHDGLPYTLEEMVDDTTDHCVVAVRVWQDGEEAA